MTERLTYDNLNRLDVWQQMPTITLDQMRSVKLMNRIDTKYVISEEEVIRLLHSVADAGYYVQIIDNVRACRYLTLYYDTPQREMFRQHHNRKLTRQKLRTRTYVESSTTFFEIKNKNNRGRTKKQRTEISADQLGAFADNGDARSLLAKHSHYTAEELSPALATRFTRITLVNPTLTERTTIDCDLSYEDMRSGQQRSIEQMVIVEIKQDGNTSSMMKLMLRDMHIAPLKVSKYCLGTTLTVSNIHCNRFKEKMRKIYKRLNKINYDTI
ncbi:MAG: polyphosphate polymerase domain-containing protein [Alistipes sp.]|nr:polyphosphate polymerase domain-containing protein [Alistipes sp.]